MATMPGGDAEALRVVAGASRGAAPRVPNGVAAPAAAAGAARLDAAAQAAAALEKAIAAGDSSQVEALMLESPFSRVRQLAAERVAAHACDPDGLKRLLHQVRGKDKTVYRILKLRCDALNAAQRQAALQANAVEALCTSLERYAERAYDDSYVSGFDELAARWRALRPPVAADAESRAVQAMERCREAIDAQRRLEERQAAERAAVDAARRAQLDAEEVLRRAAADASMALGQSQAEARREIAAREEAERVVRAQSAAAERQALRRLGGLIHKAREALDGGATQRAQGLRRAVDDMRASTALHAPTLPAHLARQLQQLDDDLANLKGWKDYAVAPKRAELILAMEALIGAAEEPKVLAARIKSLQGEWRTISRGIVSETPDEWERFHRASQAAYEPCRDYFAAEANMRQENLAGRKALLERLTAYESTCSAGDPDYRLLARVLREAPLEWRRYFPVDRDANRVLQVDFDEALGRLQARLNAWREDNAAAKRALVAQAQQLLGQDSRAAIEGVKKLQALWRETGSATRDLDQSLWTEFRDSCDAVFDKRRQVHAEFAAGIETNKAQAVALCETAERVAALTGNDLREALNVAQWRAAFDAVGELPRSEVRGLEARFARALAACDAQLIELHARDAEEAVAQLWTAARHVRAVEWAVIQSAPAAEREALEAAANAYIGSVSNWPQGALQALKEALAIAGSAADVGRDAREQALRLLCVRAEVAADRPTPAEDDALRRDFQVQRLMRSIGQGQRGEDWHEMMLEWVRIGAVSPALYDNLAARFMRARGVRSKG